MLGDIERTGTLGGGPGSDPGERRWEKPRGAGPWDCIMVELSWIYRIIGSVSARLDVIWGAMARWAQSAAVDADEEMQSCAGARRKMAWDRQLM